MRRCSLRGAGALPLATGQAMGCGTSSARSVTRPTPCPTEGRRIEALDEGGQRASDPRPPRGRGRGRGVGRDEGGASTVDACRLRTVVSSGAGRPYAVSAQTAQSALGQALIDDDAAMIQALELSDTEREAAPFSFQHPGITPLLWACGHSSDAVVKALLDAQCDVAAVSPKGLTALMLAVCSLNRSAEQTVVRLLERPAVGLLAKDSRQLTAFHYGCQHAKSVGVVNLLLRAATAQSPRDYDEMTGAGATNGRTALMLSALNQNDREADILKLLLCTGLGTQVGARDTDGRTAFHCACSHAPSSAHVSVLLRAGADPNDIDACGTTGLMFAAQNVNGDVLWDLLQWSPQQVQTIDTTNDSGWTALHFACHLGHVAAIEALVTACCNVAATTSAGKTGLMLAAECMQGTEACRVLLGWSSDELELRDASGRTARSLAAAAGHVETALLLSEKEAELLRERTRGASDGFGPTGALGSHRSFPPAMNAYESAARPDRMQATALGEPQPEPQLQPGSSSMENDQQSKEEDSEELRSAFQLSAIQEQLAKQQQELERVQLAQAIAESNTAEAARQLAAQRRQSEQLEAARVDAERRDAASRRDNAAEVRRIAERHAADEEQRQQVEAQEKQRQAEQMRLRLDVAFANFQQRRQDRQAREATAGKSDPQLEQKQQSAADYKLEMALAKMRKRREEKQLATGKKVNVTRQFLEKEARRLFNTVDNDRSGHLDAAEVKELARKLKLDLSDEDAKVAMEKMDADCNGTVDFDEFF